MLYKSELKKVPLNPCPKLGKKELKDITLIAAASEVKIPKCGKISGFCRQARFVVITGDDEMRATEYVTDFVIFYPDKTYRIVDVKGVRTQEFKLKMKAMHEKYPELNVELEEKK